MPLQSPIFLGLKTPGKIISLSLFFFLTQFNGLTSHSVLVWRSLSSFLICSSGVPALLGLLGCLTASEPELSPEALLPVTLPQFDVYGKLLVSVGGGNTSLLDAANGWPCVCRLCSAVPGRAAVCSGGLAARERRFIWVLNRATMLNPSCASCILDL